MFNLKIAKNKNTITSIEKMLDENNSDRQDSLGEKVSTINGLLEKQQDKNIVTGTYESLLDKNSREYVENGNIENRINSRSEEGSYFPHRRKNSVQSVSDVDLMSQVYDNKFREAFKNENDKADLNTKFWDKYTGTQDKSVINYIDGNISGEKDSSQLQNNPSRFDNLDGIPVGQTSEENLKSLEKDIKIQKMKMASLKEADKLILYAYSCASSESRNLNDYEKSLINKISQQKEDLINGKYDDALFQKITSDEIDSEKDLDEIPEDLKDIDLNDISFKNRNNNDNNDNNLDTNNKDIPF